MSASNIIDIASDDDAVAANLLDSTGGGGGVTNKKSILFFWAEWHPPSNTGGPFDMVVKALAQQQQQSGSSDDNGGGVQFYRVLAEEAPMLSRKHDVNALPTFLFVNSDGAVVDRIDGGEDVASVTQFYSKLLGTTAAPAAAVPSSDRSQSQSSTQQQQEEEGGQKEPQQQQSLDDRLRSLTTSSPVMLFLKGTPSAPRCGFSRQAIELLESSNVSFGYFDILSDDEVRQGMKSYSDWPTYPQLYVRGELVGGLDIMKEMAEEEDDGGLVGQLELGDFVIGSGKIADVDAEGRTAEEEKMEEEAAVSLNERLKQLITRRRIMLFMKGIPSSPRCGFSRQIVEILDSLDVTYDAFDILEDEEVRQGLKAYSDWPSYPQLYVEGDLVGGLDIVKEMMEGGELEEVLKGGGQD